MSLEIVILFFALIIITAALPAWPYSRKWGYGPSCLIGIVVLILIVLFFGHS